MAGTRASKSTDIRKEIAAAEKQLAKSIKSLLELRRKVPPLAVEDVRLEGTGGRQVPLSELFGARDELMLIHNMGRACVYCTLWADGMAGLARHLESRAAIAMVTPDDPETQAAFARSRGWTFPLVRDRDGRFSALIGYGEDGGIYPGVSTFRRHADGRIERFASAPFGPGDIYMPVFHLLDLLPEGQAGWEPRLSY